MQLLAVLCLFLLGPALAFAQAPAHATQGTLTLPTRAEGLPDTNPPFDPFQQLPNGYAYVYPYTMRMTITDDLSTQNWRALYLDNEYLHCAILPDLGGRVYNCVDNVTGADMFYANTVVKKRQVGLRGSWVALGLENNFPIGHSWINVSSVDFSFQDHPDGSASVWVANIDRVTGMQWRSEFVLRPGIAVLEQRVTLENRSDVRRRYYWWANASHRLNSGQDLFVLPTNVVAVHGSGLVDTWPVSTSGPDFSVLGNYTAGVGYFAVGTNEMFHGLYRPDTQSGLLHVADPLQVPGKKTWTWGPDPWPAANLSDDNSNYIEIQAGATPTQIDFSYLEPQQIRTLTEYWLPIRFVGGVSKANPVAVLHLFRTAAGAITAEVNATRFLPNATLQFWQNGTLLQSSDPTNLDPTQIITFSQEAVPDQSPVTVRLLDSASATLLEYTEGLLDAAPASNFTLGLPTPPSWLSPGPVSEADFLALADYDERNANYDSALVDYTGGLKAFPASTALSKGMGRLLAVLANPNAAAQLAQAAAAAADPETQYYGALASQDTAALAALQADPVYGIAATIRLAEIQALSGDPASALATIALGQAASNSNSVRAGAIELTLLRMSGLADQTASRLAYWLAIDPTDSVLHYESYRQGNDETGLWLHLAAEPERVLNVAEHLMRLGRYQDALDVLSWKYQSASPLEVEPGIPAPSAHPLIWYYRGYCQKQLGQSGATEFKTAAAFPVTYIFPNRPLTVDVMNAALQANPNDASAMWFLGSVLMSERRTDEAIAAWNPLRKLRPAIPSLHRTLGRAWLDVKGDPASAYPILNEGLQFEPDNADLKDAIIRATPKPYGVSVTPQPVSVPAGVATNLKFTWAIAAPQNVDPSTFIDSGFILIQDSSVKSPNTANACYLKVNQLGSVDIGDDAGSLGITPISWVGNSWAAVLSNSRCQVDGPSSSFLQSGSNMQLTLNLQFKHPWSGKTLSIWMRGQNTLYKQGPWQQMGSVTVQ